MKRRSHLYGFIFAAVAVLPSFASAPALPNEITVKQATEFELLRGDKVAGKLELAAGETLSVIDLKDRYVIARYRNLNGRVLLQDTTMPPSVIAAFTGPPRVATPLPASPTTAPKIGPPAEPDLAATTASSYVPTTHLEELLDGKLVRLEGGALRPFPTARLAGVRFYAIYFSAGWCPPCREFTPEFMDAYAKLRAVYPEFETIMVNRDRSPAAMFEYMRDDQMKWPALSWDRVRSATALNHYAGAGIPCLVLVDENGKVLSDSYRWGRYVGPDAVLDDTWRILQEYRRKNTRPKTD